MRHKVLPGSLLKSPTDGSGVFTALVSTFHTEPDAQGDVIAPGAFLDTIEEWRGRGRWPMVWWLHAYEDPANAVGILTSMRETDEGLVVDGRLFLERERAQALYEGMLLDLINEWSIGYAIWPGGEYTRPDGANVLTKVEVLEVSACFEAANRHTRTLAVKSRRSPPGIPAMQKQLAAAYPKLADDIAAMFGTSREQVAARATRQRAARARVDLTRRVDALQLADPEVVLVDAAMRPVFRDEAERDRERGKRFDRTLKERDGERQAELARTDPDNVEVLS